MSELQHLPRHQPWVPQVIPALLWPSQALWVTCDPATTVSLSACIPAGAASGGAGANPACRPALSPEEECGSCLIASLGDVRGHSADRGVNIQQLRCLGEARAGFSSPQGREEGSMAGQSRAQSLPSTGVLSAPGQAGAAQLLKETHPQGADLTCPGPKLAMKV